MEDRGFAHGWTYDHLAWRALADEPWHSTVVTLAIAAGATRRLKVGTWVASPNFRHPVPFAKDLMSLDDLSGGRVLAAIGAGGLGWDAEVLGQPILTPGERVDRLAEFVDLTDRLLTTSDITWHGRFYDAVRARINPMGSRQRIELIVAGNGRRSIELAARYDAWATIGADGANVDDPAAWWSRLAGLVERYDRAVGDRVTKRYLSAEGVPGYDFESVDYAVDVAGRAQALGFTDLIVHWPRPTDPYRGDDAVLDGLADQLVAGELRL